MLRAILPRVRVGVQQQHRCFSRTAVNLEVITFNMADVGEGIKEVEILEWFVKEGDVVEEFQPLCEIQSDKATTEVTSRYAGKVTKVYTAVGGTQQVGEGLVDIDAEGSSAPAPPAPKAAAPKAAKKTKKAKKAAPAGEQVITFNMADVGEGIKEVEILEWFVKEGDVVEEFQPLCEIQSDKATTEVTSRYAGKIEKLYTAAGGTQQVGAGLVDILSASGAATVEVEVEEEEEEADAAAPAPTASTPASGGHSLGFQQAGAGAKVLCSPAVRRIASEQAIDLSLVAATGKGGRVTKEDIVNYIEGVAQPATTAAAAAPASSAPASSAPAARGPIYSPEDRTEKLTGFQKMMVKSMTESLKIPAFGASDEINLNNLVEVRKILKPIVEKRGAKLSFMPFFIKAASLALKDFPIVNTQLDGAVENVTYKGSHNIGIAMDTKVGLIVPNVKDVQSKTIFQIAEDLVELQRKGTEGKLTTADLSGGTFTLSNIGSIGGTYVSPVIMAPQMAIGALGKMTKLPRYNTSGVLEAQNTMCVSWTADHRVIDGATMVRFSNAWKQYLEDPSSMLLDLQ